MYLKIRGTTAVKLVAYEVMGGWSKLAGGAHKLAGSAHKLAHSASSSSSSLAYKVGLPRVGSKIKGAGSEAVPKSAAGKILHKELRALEASRVAQAAA